MIRDGAESRPQSLGPADRSSLPSESAQGAVSERGGSTGVMITMMSAKRRLRLGLLFAGGTLMGCSLFASFDGLSDGPEVHSPALDGSLEGGDGGSSTPRDGGNDAGEIAHEAIVLVGQLTGTSRIRPDGAFVYFSSGGGIYRVEASTIPNRQPEALVVDAGVIDFVPQGGTAAWCVGTDVSRAGEGGVAHVPLPPGESCSGAIASDGLNLYVMTKDGTKATLWRLPSDPAQWTADAAVSPFSRLYTGAEVAPVSLVLAGLAGAFYIADGANKTVTRGPLTGGDASFVTPVTNLDREVAIAGASLHSVDVATRRLWKIATSGGVSEGVVEVLTPVAVAGERDILYWATADGKIRACPVSACIAETLTSGFPGVEAMSARIANAERSFLAWVAPGDGGTKSLYLLQTAP